MIELVFIAAGPIPERLFSAAFVDELQRFGRLRLVPDGSRMDRARLLAELQSAEVVITGWQAQPLPAALATAPGRVRYILHLTGTMAGIVPQDLIQSGILVTNWGNAPADGVAEGALCLLLAVLKNLHGHIDRIEAGGWGLSLPQGSVKDLRLGVYGLGAIGRTFCELCRPLGAQLVGYDPFAPEVPNVTRVSSLSALFQASEAVAIHAGLTAATRGSVTRELLSYLPDHGVLINTARGELVDQEALFAELESGRLRAGLDVLAADTLAPDHLARRWPNLIITSHQIGRADWPGEDLRPERRLSSLHSIALENLRRFVAGEEPRHVMTPERYALST